LNFSFFFITRTNERSIRPWAIVFGSRVGRPLENIFPSTKTTTGFAAGDMTDFIILFNSINCYYYFFKIHLQAADFASTVDVQHGPGRPDRLEQVRTRTRFKITF
jgi:hypothetical protein